MKRKPIEQRIVTVEVAGLELREGAADQPAQLVGHAAVFNQWTTINEWWGMGWEEMVAPGSFKKTIKEQDIRALWNHDPNIVLGRNKAGTLTLDEDEKGLAVTIEPPDSEWGRPVLEAVRRGDVSGMSIGFQVVKEEWTRPDREKEPKARPKRTIKEAKLFDVSPVTFPAFPQTDIAARGDEPRGETDDWLTNGFRFARLAEMGYPLVEEERAAVRRVGTFLMDVSGEPEAPEEGANHSPQARGDEPTTHAEQDGYRHSVAARARELRLLQIQAEVGK